MADDVLLAKAETIERCLKRIVEIYAQTPANLHNNQNLQDAMILNLERACQAAIDGAMRLIRITSLGLPKETKETFEILARANIIDTGLCDSLMKMVGFRDIAVHNYQKLNLAIVQKLIESGFVDLRKFAGLLIRFEPPKP